MVTPVSSRSSTPAPSRSAHAAQASSSPAPPPLSARDAGASGGTPRGEVRLYADRRPTLMRLPLDVLKEVVQWLPADKSELRNAALTSRTMHGIVHAFAKPNIQVADLKGIARRAFMPGRPDQSAALRDILARVEHEPGKPVLTGSFRHEVLDHALTLYVRMNRNAVPDEQAGALFRRAVDVAVNDRAPADRVKGFCIVAGHIDHLPPDMLKSVLEHAGDRVRRMAPRESARLRELLGLLLDAANLRELPDAARYAGARKLLTDAAAEPHMLHGAARHLLLKYLLLHATPLAGEEGLETFRHATALAMGDAGEDGKIEGLRIVFDALPSLDGDRRLDALEHALGLVSRETKSDAARARGLACLMEAYGRASPADGKDFAGRVLQQLRRITDPRLEFDGLLHALRHARRLVGDEPATQAVSRALDLALSAPSHAGRLSAFLELAKVFDHLPPGARAVVFGQALDGFWAAVTDDSARSRAVQALMDVFQSRPDEIGPGFTADAVGRIGEIQDPARRLEALSCVLDKARHCIPPERAAEAMTSAFGLLGQARISEAGRLGLLRKIMQPLGLLSAEQSEALFDCALSLGREMLERGQASPTAGVLIRAARESADPDGALRKLLSLIRGLASPDARLKAATALAAHPGLNPAEGESVTRFVFGIIYGKPDQSYIGAIRDLVAVASRASQQQAVAFLGGALDILEQTQNQAEFIEGVRCVGDERQCALILQTHPALGMRLQEMVAVRTGTPGAEPQP
ncbi:F-box protein [Noviherbaspirillum aridicola]|uniref:F-box domain-containing protein n=1 Tax=Noviherbaspirillum aridicola TaxID=2849687 RepID=A0ABQ4Q917_9BURK|nr:F-box protein [Noviherbaspirillum aridicola]GIZ53685.1 hypothetical protein NCCP691_36990 [Noviherbaspirillum aridicola]